MTKIKVILLFGPTAVGKTELLAELFSGRGEIINADSMQVYKGLDVGSAKPDPAYMEIMPHHLVSVLEPSEQFNTGDFVKRADECVQDIHSRGLIPVLSGGTAFYFKNFIYGLPELPVVSEHIREEVNGLYKEKGLAWLYEYLTRADGETAESLNPGDSYRVIRAVEIFKETGRGLSSFPVPDTPRDTYDFLILGLERPREELYSRINQRVDIMFDNGLADEFKRLKKQGIRESDPGMKGIGYKEFFSMMKAGCWNLEELKENIRMNSRRYAKRQITFFKSFAHVKWYNPQNKAGVLEEVDRFLG